MRRLALLGASSLALFLASLAPSAANAAFTQCPAVELDSGCQFLFTITDSETSVESDPSLGPFDPGGDDALIGVQNHSSKTISSMPLSAEIELFGFEFDGICSMTKPAPGCQVLPRDAEGNPTLNPGKPCPPELEACGFPPPKGEPTTVTFPPAIGIVGRGENGQPVTGYEGPRTWYTDIEAIGAFATGKGVVHFDPPLAPGESTYFSLESPPVGGFGTVSTLSTTLSGGGTSGGQITVLQGAAVTDSATLGGLNASSASGSVNFAVYSDSECKNLVTQAGSAKLSNGSAGPSSAETLAPGKYYWQAKYPGTLENQPATSSCGSEVLTVLAPTSTSTSQTGGGLTGTAVTVPVGTPVTDTAAIAGSLAASSTGTVTYTLYKDSKCTVPALAAGTAGESKGAAGPSAPVTPAAGVYYWLASYSGDGSNAGSASACGSEVLTVAKPINFGLGQLAKKCASKRRFVAHVKAPNGVKLTSVEVQINGKRKLTAKLNKNRATTINLIGLPKGTFKVAMIAKSPSGQTYEDVRTFHTCIPKIKHHKKHKRK